MYGENWNPLKILLLGNQEKRAVRWLCRHRADHSGVCGIEMPVVSNGRPIGAKKL